MALHLCTVKIPVTLKHIRLRQGQDVCTAITDEKNGCFLGDLINKEGIRLLFVSRTTENNF